ncbi:hypothetical protein HMI54_012434 [Coelomomyces lativittatus]|nr:hypothetical protein HMI55_005262 [Coelomomyces lativittatus]KAJ1498485.1 hypothetical protein HMI56_004959 [Coelomomyces lativittatus]KAJ1498741.1 hypothetical protein HMI54_012434 [Coelomomyces lativittatus]
MIPFGQLFLSPWKRILQSWDNPMASRFIPSLPTFYKYLCGVPKIVQTPPAPKNPIFVDAMPTQIAATSKDFTYIRQRTGPIFENEAMALLEQYCRFPTHHLYSDNTGAICCFNKGSSNNAKVNNWLQHLAMHELTKKRKVFWPHRPTYILSEMNPADKYSHFIDPIQDDDIHMSSDEDNPSFYNCMDLPVDYYMEEEDLARDLRRKKSRIRTLKRDSKQIKQPINKKQKICSIMFQNTSSL